MGFLDLYKIDNFFDVMIWFWGLKWFWVSFSFNWSLLPSILFLGCFRICFRRFRQPLICWFVAVRFMVDRWMLFKACLEFVWFMGSPEWLLQTRMGFSTSRTVPDEDAAGVVVMVAGDYNLFFSVSVLLGFVSGFGFPFGPLVLALLFCMQVCCSFFVLMFLLLHLQF